MSTKHTPGPWLAQGVDDDNCDPPTRSIWVTSAGRAARNVCQVVDHGGADDDGHPGALRWRDISAAQLKADAALIAAAPDLLEAATEVLAQHIHLECCAAEATMARRGRVAPCDCGLQDLKDAIAKARGGA